MRTLLVQTIAGLTALLVSTPAFSLCSGGTVASEFREADLVVRARLVSQVDAWDDAPTPAFTAAWGDASVIHTAYGLDVLDTYKGKLTGRLRVFENHDSGAFYIDADKDYLLFLKRIPDRADLPAQARGAFFVPFTCGQSMPVSAVNADALAQLGALKAGK